MFPLIFVGFVWTYKNTIKKKKHLFIWIWITRKSEGMWMLLQKAVHVCLMGLFSSIQAGRSTSISDEKYSPKRENGKCFFSRWQPELRWSESLYLLLIVTAHHYSSWKESSVRESFKALSWEQISHGSTIKPNRSFAFLCFSLQLGPFHFSHKQPLMSLSSLINAASHDHSMHRSSSAHTEGWKYNGGTVSLNVQSLSFIMLIHTLYIHMLASHKHTNTHAAQEFLLFSPPT